MVIVQQLGRLLPDNYIAGPHVNVGMQVQVDVATFENESPRSFGAVERGGVATQLWAPPQPSLEIQTALGNFDEYEVRIYDALRERRLVAEIELISPANKDRPETRSQFVSKCAALLRQGVCVVLVDIVTTKQFNLYSDLLAMIGERDPLLSTPPTSTYAVSLRWHSRGADYWLEAWNHDLRINSPLPVLPLWLSENLAVSLDLEAS